MEQNGGLRKGDLEKVLDEYKDKPVDEVVNDLNTVPFFMNQVPEGEHDAVEALKAMAYEGEPIEIATNFRQQGNEAYKTKQYSTAAAFYTKALEQKTGDKDLEVACYNNRAQCQLLLRNYGKCIKDCDSVLGLDPKNVKAIFRKAKALSAVARWDEAKVTAESGLQVDADNQELQNVLKSVEEQLHIQQEKIRLEKERKLAEEHQKRVFKMALDARNIKRAFPTAQTNDQVLKPELEDPNDPNSLLSIPIMAMYPLVLQSDLVQDVAETSTVGDVVDQLFTQPPPWADADYRLGNLECYAPTATGGLAKVGLKMTIGKVLGTEKPRIVLMSPYCVLYVVPKNKAAAWLQEYNKTGAREQFVVEK